MDNFKEKFIEEALDLINDLEKVLLRFEKDTENKDVIGKIFRIMHTLKGNSAMFGFVLIDQYTHHLETIYDLIRNGKMKVSSELLNLTLASVDHIRNLLDEDNQGKTEVQATHKELLNKIDLIIGKKHQEEEKKCDSSSEKSFLRTFYVYFNPSPDILSNGTNPLFLVEDFGTLGDYISIPVYENLPDFHEIDPEKCYVSWEIILACHDDEQKIREIFIFAEDNCTLEIRELSETNLLVDQDFKDKIYSISDGNKKIGEQKLKDLLLSEKKTEKTTQKAQPRDINEVALKNISSIRVSSEKLDELINLVSELVTTQAGLSLLSEKINNKELLVIAEDIEKLSRRLRDNTFGMRLIPIENMITRFQRLVRELSHNLNKDIEFSTEGIDIELDKNIIEGLIDPIMHIIRNCIDHGIESRNVRKIRGKPEKGTISFKAFHSGSNVFIKISDDGKGIDGQIIRECALKRGLITPEMNLSQREILDLVFLPGFSTAENVTNISGRGVGMDVVKRKISELRGEVFIESLIERGTSILLKLPLTLSIIDGLLVAIDNAYFVIPLSSINKCFEFRHEMLVNAVNNLIFVNDGHIPFIYLRNEFGIKTKCPALEEVVVIEYGESRIGLTVDKVIGEYQAVLKSLGNMYKKQDLISGATILGDGTVALVLDPNKIISQFNYQNQVVMK